jgi:pimeloyl-ACP methyl ester carboxylesterase
VKAILMPGVGHFLMLEDPATFNRLLAGTIAELR